MTQRPDSLHRLVDRDGCRADVEERVAALEDAATLPENEAGDRRALQVLGDETRHRIVRLLIAAGEELCVCEITPVVDVTDSAISHALSDLTDAGLVTRRKEGTWRFYAATDRAHALVDALDRTREGDR